MSKNVNIRPLGSRVLVQPLEEDQRSPGGILIPDNAKEKPTWGIVLAVGPGKLLETGKLQPLEIKVNDKVLFGKYSGTEIKHNGKELLVMREDDIMGVMTTN